MAMAKQLVANVPQTLCQMHFYHRSTLFHVQYFPFHSRCGWRTAHTLQRTTHAFNLFVDFYFTSSAWQINPPAQKCRDRKNVCAGTMNIGANEACGTHRRVKHQRSYIKHAYKHLWTVIMFPPAGTIWNKPRAVSRDVVEHTNARKKGALCLFDFNYLSFHVI